jgi:hypothetical protein
MATDREAAPSSQNDSLLKKIWCDLKQRVNGFWEFMGFLFSLIFSLRRLWLALGGALIGAGLARCLIGPNHPTVFCVLSSGGAIVGFFGPRTSN